MVGRFAALFRNVLQMIVVCMVMDYFQKANVLHTVIGRVMEVDGVSKYVAGQPMAYIPAVLQLIQNILCIPVPGVLF